MVVQALQQVARSVARVGQETGQFRRAAAQQNRSISDFIKDVSKMFSSQNKQQGSISSSLDDIQYNSQQTNSKVDRSNDLIQESISIQSQMLSELKNVSNSISSLIESITGSGGIGGGGGFGLGSLAAAGAVGAGAGLLGGYGLDFLNQQTGSNIGGNSSNSSGGGPAGTSDTGGGERLNVAKLTDLAKKAGFQGEDAAIMGAIAAAESSGNPRAFNPKGRDLSYGLWQINMLGGMGPERRRQFGISNNEELYNPETNAKAAKTIYDQQGFKAWSVYTSGAYKKYLGTARESLNAQTANVEAAQAISKEDGGESISKSSPGILNSTGKLSSKGSLKERKGFIIHHTGGRGSVDGVINTLNQRGLSVQFIIDREGKIHQVMPSGSRASHMRKGKGVGAGLSNSNTEGVEIIAKNDADVLPVQVEAAKRLAAQLGYSPSQVYGHGEVNPHKQRTEGSTVVSSIRGNTNPATAEERKDASGGTNIAGMQGGSKGGSQGGSQGGEQVSSGLMGDITSLMGMGGIAGALGSLASAGMGMFTKLTGAIPENTTASYSPTPENNTVSASQEIDKVAKTNYQPSETIDNRAETINNKNIELASVPKTDSTQKAYAYDSTGGEPKTSVGVAGEQMALNATPDNYVLADWYTNLFGKGGGNIVPSQKDFRDSFQ